MSKSPTTYLLDASIYIFRAWFSMPDRWHTADGWPVNAVYGYAGFLLDFLQQPGPNDRCAAAFDESLGTCFRNEIYPEYKSSRALPDEVLAFQLQACRDITESLGVACFSGARFEADDYLATLARLQRESGQGITVVTRDKDLGQLLTTDADCWWDFAADTRLDANGFAEKFGVRPDQFADYLALVGDKVDDIPGVPGIGARTAARLLQHFSGLGELKQGLAKVSGLDIRGAARVEENLRTHWPMIAVARQLTALNDRVPDVGQAPLFTLTVAALENAAELMEGLGMPAALAGKYRRLASERSAA